MMYMRVMVDYSSTTFYWQIGHNYQSGAPDDRPSTFSETFAFTLSWKWTCYSKMKPLTGDQPPFLKPLPWCCHRNEPTIQLVKWIPWWETIYLFWNLYLHVAMEMNPLYLYKVNPLMKDHLPFLKPLSSCCHGNEPIIVKWIPWWETIYSFWNL